MELDPEQLNLAIARTQQEIACLNRGLTTLKEAFEFLRTHPNILASLNGPMAQSQSSHREGQDNSHIKSEGQDNSHIKNHVLSVAGDMKGKTILECVDILFAENGNDWLSPQEIVKAALSRGYRTSSSRNPTNDLDKIANSVRVMMSRLGNKYERKEGKSRLKVSG